MRSSASGSRSYTCWKCAARAEDQPQYPTLRRHFATSSSRHALFPRSRPSTHSMIVQKTRIVFSKGRATWGSLSQKETLRRPRVESVQNSIRRYASQVSHTPDAEPSFEPTIFSDGSPTSPRANDAGANSKIRQRLRQWQKENGMKAKDEATDMFSQFRSSDTLTPSTNGSSLEERVYSNHESAEEASVNLTGLSGEMELDGLDPQHRVLRPGDLCELAHQDSSRDPFIAVFIRKLDAIKASPSQFFTSNGKWLHAPEMAVQFTVPNFIDRDLIEKIIPDLPAVDHHELRDVGRLVDLSVPRQVSAPIVSRLASFEQEGKEIYRKNAARLDRAHEILAHEENLRFFTLQQIGERLLEKDAVDLTDVDLFATRLALNRAGIGFSVDFKHHRMTGFVNIRSKARTHMIDRVRNWIREYREELVLRKSSRNPTLARFKTTGGQIVHGFVQKSKELINASRRDREPTRMGALGPSKVRLPLWRQQSCIEYVSHESIVWSAEEKDVIQFMETWTADRGFFHHSFIDSQPTIILHATGLYEDFKLDEQMGFVFLQEIGVYLPYENRIRYSENLLLPSSQLSKPLERLMSQMQVAGPSTIRNLVHEDIMKDLRHDWGDLPVFCIDRSGSHEIDDGVSIEPTADNGAWIHIHVANPTSCFKPDTPLGVMARHMTETLYLPERAYMMMPDWASRIFFSLAKNRPVLTFSAKLNADGVLEETTIRSGRIHNVLSLDPKDLGQYLDDKQIMMSKDVHMVVGGKVPEVRSRAWGMRAADLSPRDLRSLQNLRDFATKRFRIRMKKGGIALTTQDSEVKVWTKGDSPGLGWSYPMRNTPRHVRGDPVIALNNSEFTGLVDISGKMTAGSMVQEYMLLASEIAGRWCEARNVPIIYRGSLPHLDGPQDIAERFLREKIEPVAERNEGMVPFYLLTQYLERSRPSIITLEPLSHDQIGLSHYTKVTSPLRRYGDMVVHWQIEAALREEARTGTSLMGSSGPRDPPFSEAKLRQLVTNMRAREYRIKEGKLQGIRFWTTMLLFRAHYFGEAQLPSKMTVYVSNTVVAGAGLVSGYIQELGIQCRVALDKTPQHDIRIGDSWEATFQDLDTYWPMITMLPIRLVRRAEDL